MVVEQIGSDSDIFTYLQEVVAKMERALEEGDTTLITVDEDPLPPSGSREGPRFKGTLVFLTDGSCGSSCLTFASEVWEMPHVVHVGRPTHGNSFYLEGRRQLLPSNIAILTLPMKVIRHRKRGFDEVYTPRYRFEGNMSDTSSIERWIEETFRSKTDSTQPSL